MAGMFKEVREQIYNCLIDYMRHYGDSKQEFVIHASIFDLRRIPAKDGTPECDELMKAVDLGLEFFMGFCQKKHGLQYDEASDSMKTVEVNLFKGLPEPTVEVLRAEYIDALPEFRSLKKNVHASMKQIEDAKNAAINNPYTLNASYDYYSQTDAWEQFLSSQSHKFTFLTVIVSMLVVFPTNSAGCERIFSATAWLKNERRNRMLDDILNANLHVKFNMHDIDYSLL